MTEPLFVPFIGDHYADAASLGRRLAPPYDVLSPAQRDALAARDPANIVQLDLPTGADPYAEAARLLAEWRGNGTLARDAAPTAYVLRTTTRFEDGTTRARTGVFLALAVEPYTAGRVKPHEKTHAGPKEDRRRLTHATAANLSPIFVLAPDSDGALARLLADVTTQAPWASADAIGARQDVWIVDGAAAQAIAAAASAAPVYIADGHHRFETAVVIGAEAPPAWRAGARRTLAHVVSFKDPGLEILATHRIVEGAPVSRDALRAAVAPYFVDAGDQPPTLTLVCGDGSELPLMLRKDADLSRAPELPAHPSVRALAVAQCDAIMIGVVAKGIQEKAPTFRYTAYANEARAAARETGTAFVIMLPPTKLEEVKAVSDAGEIMPPKSTFFAPKVPTGVVIRPLDAVR